MKPATGRPSTSSTRVLREEWTHFSEGGYAETENQVRQLLTENGVKDLQSKVEPLPSGGASSSDVTPESYIGTWRQTWTIANHDKYQPGKTVDYEAGEAALRDRVYLDGSWVNGREAFTAIMDAKAFLKFRAGAVNVVLEPSGAGCFPVWLDGAPIPANIRGGDVVERDGGTCIAVGEEDSYDIYQGAVDTFTLRLDVRLDTELYTFAFSRQDMSPMCGGRDRGGPLFHRFTNEANAARDEFQTMSRTDTKHAARQLIVFTAIVSTCLSVGTLLV
jgi:hypothetical protein